MDTAVAQELDKKYKILRRTYNEDEFKALKTQILVTVKENPRWKEEWITDLTVQRFLQQHGNVGKAHGYLVKMFNWRADNNIDDMTLDKDVQEEEATGRSEVLKTPDACGRPVVYFRVRNHDKNHGNIERVQKHTIYTFEQLSKLSDQNADGKFTSVFDLQGFSYRNMDLELVKKALTMLEQYYPDRNGVILLINYPAVFYGFWKIIRLLLNEIETSNVLFCGKEELSDFIDISSPPFNLIMK